MAVAAVLVTRTTVSGAQVTVRLWEGEGCAQSTVSATIGRCGLMLSHNELFRGMPGSVVAIGEPMSPVRLSRYVRGEKARDYARRYEWQTRTGGIITFAGLAATLAQSVMAARESEPFRNPDGTANQKRLIPFFGSVAVAGAGFPITWLGARNGRRAVEAHNATLTRQ